MRRLIEQQAVIDCLANTAKYYDMPQADEWTKGIHYGLLHGIDNILDNVKPVEAIPKADYENRLKADLKAILVELQLEIEEKVGNRDFMDKKIQEILQRPDRVAYEDDFVTGYNYCLVDIQQRINALKGEKRMKKGTVVEIRDSEGSYEYPKVNWMKYKDGNLIISYQDENDEERIETGAAPDEIIFHPYHVEEEDKNGIHEN